MQKSFCFKSYFDESVDPDQLASHEPTFLHTHDVSILIINKATELYSVTTHTQYSVCAY